MIPNPDSYGEPSREELIALMAAQAAEIAALKARIAELERRVGLNSSNSGKPAVQRWAQEAGSGQEHARAVGTAVGRAERPQRRDPASGRRARQGDQSLPAVLRGLWVGDDA